MIIWNGTSDEERKRDKDQMIDPGLCIKGIIQQDRKNGKGFTANY
jgi:hypothetical protein